jgi:hypothetical protein
MSDTPKQKIIFDQAQVLQEGQNEEVIKNAQMLNGSILSSMVKTAIGSADKKRPVPRLAFTEQPNQMDTYAGVFKIKRNLLPNSVIKQIRTQNFLIAGILRTRGNMMSMFGRTRADRFDIGLEIDVKAEFKEHIEPEQMVVIQERMDAVNKLLINCGSNEGLKDSQKMTLSQFFDVQTRNSLSFAFFTTEIIRDTDKKFHRFRPVDAGTIYRTVRKGESAQGIRNQSIKALENLAGERLEIKRVENDEYAYIQVVEGIPRQAFTEEEMILHNVIEPTDIEHNGYPVTILDTIINAVTTHTSIELYNKLYFQNGKAARGMLVIKSDEIDQSTIEDIKQQFNASINNVTNSFRTPIFGVSKADEVDWVSTQPNKKDGEFQYLSDFTSRNILMAFNISADELPSYGYLARATNSQTLSESNNEFKLTAARDSGIRPLILKFEDFINQRLLPLIDPELAQIAYVSLAGFDAETKQQESARLIQDTPLHYHYDELMEEVDKEQVGPHMAGKIPFNELYNTKVDGYVDMNVASMNFLDSPASFVDPILRYRRDPFWQQNIQTLMQVNPAAAKAYYTTRKDSLVLLKKLVKDQMEEEE